MKRPILLIIFIAFIIAGLTIAQINVGNKIATAGSELSQIQSEVDKYERENSILQEQILDTSSYTNIEEKAKELGFAPVKKSVSMVSAPPLAMKQ